jgi:dCMP deaminase
MIIGIRGPDAITTARAAAHLAARGFLRLLDRGTAGDEAPPRVDQHYVMDVHEAPQTYARLSGRADFRELAVPHPSPPDWTETMLDRAAGALLATFERPSWDEYFLRIAEVVATRSNCLKRHVAAIIVKDKRIVATGYNGTPRGTKNCNEGGCPRCASLAPSGTSLEDCLCSHAEENAITQAAYHGTSIRDAVLYTTFSPCLLCTKMIINSGIREVVYGADYPLGETALRLLQEAKVIVRRFPEREP